MRFEGVATRSGTMSKGMKSKVLKKNDTKISSADDLMKTSKKSELDEEELNRVSGGVSGNLTIPYTKVEVEYKTS
jgi:bacteriocin-like protein